MQKGKENVRGARKTPVTSLSILASIGRNTQKFWCECEQGQGSGEKRILMQQRRRPVYGRSRIQTDVENWIEFGNEIIQRRLQQPDTTHGSKGLAQCQPQTLLLPSESYARRDRGSAFTAGTRASSRLIMSRRCQKVGIIQPITLSGRVLNAINLNRPDRLMSLSAAGKQFLCSNELAQPCLQTMETEKVKQEVML